MELALKKETVAYCGCVFEKSVKQNLDLGWNLPDYCGEIRRILYCEVTPCVCGVSCGSGRVAAQGEIQVRLVYLNEKGQIDLFFETAELSAAAELPAAAQDAQLLAAVQVLPDGGVDLTLDCRLQGELYDVRRLNLCTDAAPDDTAEERHVSALTLYFAQQGEVLWDIAKRYRTTVEAIQKENALSAGTVPEERMIFVPR